MPDAILEHANITVSDADRTIKMLCDIFGWRIRWKGPAIDGGTSTHVGAENSYLAIYAPKSLNDPSDNSYKTPGGLNHVGIVVNDLDATEERVKAAGLNTHSHADYEPGCRFYFNDHDHIEYEVVSYA
jgi:catechol 2,3-dioxygenase-like lactoylglutathione lyase family enzyme